MFTGYSSDGKESIATKVMRNSVFVLIARGAQILASFYILIAVARYLSVDQYGDYVFIINFVSSIMALTYFGIQQVMIREIAKDRGNANKYLGSAIILRVALSVIAALVLIINMQFFNFSSLLKIAVLIAIISEFFLTFGMLMKAVFQAFERMAYEAVVAIVYSLILIIGIILSIKFNMGFLWLLISAAIANAIQCIIAIYLLSKRFVYPSFNINRNILWEFFKYSSVIGIGIFFYQNLFRLNILMLKWLNTSESVAFFQVPHGLIMQLEVIPAALVASIFPILSKLLNSEPSKAITLFEKLFKYIFILSFIPAIYLFIFSQEVIEVIFKGKYEMSIPALSIMSWAIIPLSMDMFLNSVLIAMNKQKYSVIYGGLTIAVNFLAAFFLIPSYGFISAAYIALFSYSILFLCSVYFVVKNGLPLVLDKIIGKTAFSVILSGASIFILKQYSFILAVSVGLIVYFVLLIWTRVFSLDELLLLIQFRKFSEKRI